MRHRVFLGPYISQEEVIVPMKESYFRGTEQSLNINSLVEFLNIFIADITLCRWSFFVSQKSLPNNQTESLY